MLYIYLAMLESPADKEKMTDLYLTYKDYMHNTAQDILHNESDAEDVVHEAFTRIANNFSKIGEISSHQTRNYLVIIVKGLALNLCAKRGRVAEVPLENLDGTDEALAVDDRILELIEFEPIRLAVEKLPSTYREALYMMHYQGYSVKEISKYLGLTEGAVKKRLQRARQAALKILLTEEVETINAEENTI